MDFKRRFVPWIIALDLVCFALFAMGMLGAAWLLVEMRGKSASAVLAEKGVWKAWLFAGEICLLPVVHGGFRYLNSPAATLHYDYLSVRDRFKRHVIPYDKINSVSFSDRALISYRDNRGSVKVVHVHIKDEDGKRFSDELKKHGADF